MNSEIMDAFAKNAEHLSTKLCASLLHVVAFRWSAVGLGWHVETEYAIAKKIIKMQLLPMPWLEVDASFPLTYISRYYVMFHLTRHFIRLTNNKISRVTKW